MKWVYSTSNILELLSINKQFQNLHLSIVIVFQSNNCSEILVQKINMNQKNIFWTYFVLLSIFKSHPSMTSFLWFPFLISCRTSVVVLATLVRCSVSGMNIAAFSWQFLSFFLLIFPAFWVLSIVAQFFNLLRGQRNERVAVAQGILI